MSRERLAWRKLAAQGFSMLPDFFRQKAKKEQQEARLAALVAANAAQPVPAHGAWRSVQPMRQYIQEEEEETESDSGPDTVSGSSLCMPASGVLIPSDSETCWKAPPIPLEESEESEESSSCGKASSDSGNDEPDHDSECPPSKRTRHDLNLATTRRLEELCHGNNPSVDPKFVPDNTLELLQDHTQLEAVQEQLAVMAGDKKMGPTLCSRVQAMVGILNLFLDGDLVLDLEQWRHIGTHSILLEDEDVSQEIRSKLEEKMKSGSIKAADLVDIIASPKMQEQLKLTGIEKPSISECMAHRWLGRLGWWYGRRKSGMYIDGHECKDIVQYRSAFMQRFKQYEQHFHVWDDNGEDVTPPQGR
ncbi:hypothetical protein EDB89DRAFT_2082892 [Lactarius sanguifluus]|nr:hypothetical protein EDB89DRAFT_2082892 [Lactarius sanguifluus]